MDASDHAKKEQDRILRTMTKARSTRGGAITGPSARPVSWNVQLSGRSVGDQATRKAGQEEALKALQEQIKQEEKANDALKLAASHEASADQPYQKPQPVTSQPVIHQPVSPVTSPKASVGSPPLSLEEQAELNTAAAFNEQRELERLNKWTRGGGKDAPKKSIPAYERPTPAVLLRQFDTETPAHQQANAQHQAAGYQQASVYQAPPDKATPEKASDGSPPAQSPEPSPQPSPQITSQPVAPIKVVHPDYTEGVSNITKSFTIAAKALKQRNSEALVKANQGVVIAAKTLAALSDDDPDVISWAKALEAITNQLRTRVDGGGTGHEYYNEISNALGQLFLNIIALS